MTRKYAALAALGTLAACGLPRLRPVEVGDTLVFDRSGFTARVTVERVGDCDTFRAEAKRVLGPRTVWIHSESDGKCAWASGTLENRLGRPALPLTVIDEVRGFYYYNKVD